MMREPLASAVVMSEGVTRRVALFLEQLPSGGVRIIVTIAGASSSSDDVLNLSRVEARALTEMLDEALHE